MDLLTLKLSLIKAHDQLNNPDISSEDFFFIKARIWDLEQKINHVELGINYQTQFSSNNK